MTEQRTVGACERFSVYAAMEKWWLHVRRRRASRAAIRQLYELDERLLRDIGIERGQIHAAINGLLDAGPQDEGVIVPFAKSQVHPASSSARHLADDSREKASSSMSAQSTARRRSGVAQSSSVADHAA